MGLRFQIKSGQQLRQKVTAVWLYRMKITVKNPVEWAISVLLRIHVKLNRNGFT